MNEQDLFKNGDTKTAAQRLDEDNGS